MKITKKFTSIILTLLIALSSFAGLAITVNAADAPTSAKLTIHKYDLDETTRNADNIGNTDTLTGTTADAPANGKALAGVEFTIYYQGPLGTVTPQTADTSDAAKVQEVTTDANGIAEFTTPDGKTGLYYVVETSSPDKVTTKAAPFYVNLPMTNQNGKDTAAAGNGATWNADVHVYPKNLTTLGGAKLTKTINKAAPTATLAQAPKFQLAASDGTVIAKDIEAKAGYNTVAKKAGLDAKYDTVVIAHKDGVIAVDGLPVGTYSFTETGAAKITANGKELPMDTTPRTFTVTKGNNVDVVTADDATFGNLSKINADDNDTYEFTMDNSEEPTVAKSVDKPDGASYGEDVTWTITPVVPADIDTYKKYVVTDTIDSRLDIAGASAVTVKLDGAAYTEAAVTYDETTRLVTVDFDGHFAELTGKTLTIEIVTKIKSTAVAYEKIKNKATLTYRNNFQTADNTTDSNEPETYTGEFEIVKVDKANPETKLANVEFTLKNAEGTEIKVLKDATGYYVSDDATATSTVVTDTNGTIVVRGLKPGDYTLTETKTNNGYQLPTNSFAITVARGAKGDVVTIENVKQPDLPLTGGMGTMLFTAIGIVFFSGAAFFFIRSRKSRKEGK